MTSSTAEQNPTTSQSNEEEPLLQNRVDDERPVRALPFNFITGTAILAQVGMITLVVLIWTSVLKIDFMLFSLHPLLNSVGVLLMLQAILVLQPTSTTKDKKGGTYVHAIINTIAVACFISAFVVIEVNKSSHPSTRLQSFHGKIGLITYILIIVTWLVGVAQYFAPKLVFGSLEKAKAFYIHHRMMGYITFVHFPPVIALATLTYFNQQVLHIKLWVVIVCSLLVLAGLVPRIQKHKLGY